MPLCGSAEIAIGSAHSDHHCSILLSSVEPCSRYNTLRRWCKNLSIVIIQNSWYGLLSRHTSMKDKSVNWLSYARVQKYYLYAKEKFWKKSISRRQKFVDTVIYPWLVYEILYLLVNFQNNNSVHVGKHLISVWWRIGVHAFESKQQI